MTARDRTGAGGRNGAFQKTHWSQIVRARTNDPGRRREVLGDILGRYWRPVYWYLRRKGYNDEDAKDLVQGFFQEIVLGRDLVQHADQRKGRFRTFLLTALDNYARDIHRRQSAGKRSPEGGLARLDAMGAPAISDPLQATPEEAFHHAWASKLLDEALADLEQECRSAGKEVHWAVFQARLLLPIREGAEPPSLSALCAEHGIADEKTASNMVVTVKRRFQTAFRRRIRETVSSDQEIDAEIRDLMEILGRGGAAS